MAGLYSEASPEGVTFIRRPLQVYGRGEILLVEVHQRVGKPVISVCKRTIKALTIMSY